MTRVINWVLDHTGWFGTLIAISITFDHEYFTWEFCTANIR